MGVHNFKIEAEVFQQVPFQIGGGITPVETKPDPTILATIASQIGQLTATVNQLTQFVAGQAFTRAAPQGGADVLNTTEEIRKLNQRLDDLESRVPRAREAKA